MVMNFDFGTPFLNLCVEVI